MSTQEKQCGCSGNENTSETGCGCSKPVITDSTGESGCGCSGENSEKRVKLSSVSAPPIYRERRPVKGEVVTVIDVRFDSSGIDLVDTWSRAVPRGDIHEIMLWSPDEEEDDAAAIAFIEITQGGNIVNGDEVSLDGEVFGSLAGFDYNHMPNHMNIVVETKRLDPLIKLGSVIEFTPKPSTLTTLDCC